jgi:hypothetical protein
MKIKHTIERNEAEVEVEVSLTYYRGYRGYRDKYGAQEEPDEPATFEVESVIDNQGHEYDLTDAEYDEVMEKAWKQRAENEGTQD